MRFFAIFATSMLLLLSGCAQEEKPSATSGEVVCNEPYIRNEAGCCLDQNANGVCDRDESVELAMEEKNGTLESANESANATASMNESPKAEQCNASDAVFMAIRDNLLVKSNECRTSRVLELCNVCGTCCDQNGFAKIESSQRDDPFCYACAGAKFNATRARDYYDRMGAYDGLCAAGCPSLVDAYRAQLAYAELKNCALPDSWAICRDVSVGK